MIEITLLYFLLPGIIAYGVAKFLTGEKHIPVTVLLLSLIVHSCVVLMAYSLIALNTGEFIPSTSQLLDIYLSAREKKSATDVTKLLESKSHLLWRATATCLLLSTAIGFLSALESEKCSRRRLFKKLGIFQGSQTESTWKRTFDVTYKTTFAQFRQKDGRTIVGIVINHSSDWKDGGLVLKRVNNLNESGEFEQIADFAYIPTQEIEGALFFTGTEESRKQEDLNEGKQKSKPPSTT